MLHLIQENPELSQRELARTIGVSVGGVNYVLSSFLEKGLVKFCNVTAAEDKRRYAYILTAKGIAEKAAITRKFLARKIEEHGALKAEIDALASKIDGDAAAPPVPR